MIVEVEQPGVGRFPVPGNPVKLDGLPDPATRPAAPALDGDRARILAWLDSMPLPPEDRP